MRVTPLMLTALTHASRNPLRRTHHHGPGKPAWPANPATLHALTKRGLLERTELRNRKGYRVEVWMITQLGHNTLNPPKPVRRDTPRYLARPSRQSGDYTSNPARAIDPLEAVDAFVLNDYAREARERHQLRCLENDGTPTARMVRMLRKRASRRGDKWPKAA